MKKGRPLRKYEKRSIAATITLIAVFVLASSVFVFSIFAYTRQSSLRDLASTTESTKDSLEEQFRADRTMLRLIARIIAESGDSLHSLDVTRYLNIYDVNSLISDIAILTPENGVIRVSGKDLDAEGILDFDDILEKGEHISVLMPDLETAGVLDLRSFVPIRRDGETIAFLYGTTTPEGILGAWIPEIYDGHAVISVIDRKTGNFLIDSLGRENTEIGDIGNTVTDISVDTDLTTAIRTGRTGYAIARDASGEEQYFCYTPMNIADWELVISVPAEDVFASVRPVRISLNIFILVEAVALVIYFLYVLHNIRTSITGIERRANIDALTRLQNRNRYEYFCEHLAAGCEGLCCIYFDVNGLHEMNNTKGHVAGDEMLKKIAEILQEEYGEPNTYRIGGDEFVAIRYDRDEAGVRADLEKVRARIEAENYHVACGMSVATPDRKFAEVVRTAEKEMYADKKRYYDSIGKEMRG